MLDSQRLTKHNCPQKSSPVPRHPPIFVQRSFSKVVEVLGVEPKSCVATIESDAPPFVKPLSLSPKGCRRVLTPRCSMIPHLQKEQSLGRFELTFFRLLTGSYPVQGSTSILERSVALT